MVKGSAGAHVTLPAAFCPPAMGLVDTATSDGRILFVLPWQGATLVGTTDRACDAPPARSPAAAREDVAWITREAGRYLRPELAPRAAHVQSTWAGVRPLVTDPNLAGDAGSAELSRDHVVSRDPGSGSITVAGGKWTTYREMAVDAMDTVVVVLPPAVTATTGRCRALCIQLGQFGVWR